MSRFITCKRCRVSFEIPVLGRRITVCSACKKLRDAEYNKQWKRKHRSKDVTLRPCDICGKELAKLHRERDKEIWLCPNHKYEVLTGRRDL